MTRLLRRMTALATIVVAGAVSLGALPGLNGYQGREIVDVRAYGAKCDGTTDDAAAFSAAYDDLTTRGGDIVVPNTGSACMIGSDVGVEANVGLVCQRGATLKATAGGSYTLGLFSWFVIKDDTSVEGCTFDLNGKVASALWVNGNRFSVRNNRFSNGATSNGTAWSLTYFGGQGEVTGNTVTCANTSGAKDQGLTGNGGNTVGLVASANVVTNCDAAGITFSNNATLTGNYVAASSSLTTATGIAGTAYTEVLGNLVSMAGSTTTGISMSGTGVVGDNYVASTGASAIGISASGSSARVAGNYVTGSGTTNTGFYISGGTVRVEGNAYLGTAETGGTEAEVAFDVRGLGTRLVGNVSNFFGSAGVDENNWHVKVAGQQTRIVGNYFLNGKFGVAPDNSSATTQEINAYVLGNEIWGIGGAGSMAVVAVTGWFVDSNYLAWNEYVGVSVGDARGTQKAITNHTKINSNRLHSNSSTGQGIVFANVGKLCDGGTKQGQSCVNDNTTDCPGATCPNCCDATGYVNITIVGNEFLYGGSTGPVIDIANAVTASTSSTVDAVMIDGSVFSLGASEDAIGFPSSNQSLVTRVWIGDFVQNGNTAATIPISNFTAAQGVLANYPQTVADLPAAACINAIGISFWDLPSSNPAAQACVGSTYARGVLNFTDGGGAGSALSAYTSFTLPYPWTGFLYADVWWGNNNTTAGNVVWQVTGVCVADDDGEDPSFSSTANTVTAAVDTTNALDVDRQTITLSNASNNPLNTCAAGETMHLRLYRDPAHASDSTTTSTASLYRVVLRQW